MSTVASYEPIAVAPARRRQINPRLLVVIGVFAALVGYPTYRLVKTQLNHGVEKVGGGYAVELKSLGDFRFDGSRDTIDRVPPEYRALDGQKVTLQGFVFQPSSAGPDATSFQFVYNVSKCCFNGPPLVQERVFATARRKATIAVPTDQVMVSMTGTLHVKVERLPETGEVASIYTMDVDHLDSLD